MKASFVLYADAYDSIRTLSAPQKGQLLDAIFLYQRGEGIPEMDAVVSMAFSFIRRSFDRDSAKYAKKCEKASAAAKMRWHANACERIKRNAFDADNDTVPVLVPDLETQEKDNTPPTPHRGEERAEQPKRERKSKPAPPLALADDFAAFWAAYPRRTAKADAVKAWNKLAKSGDLPELPVLLTAISQQAEANDWAREDGRYCPYPATWLNGKRWEDAVGVTSTAHAAADMRRYREWATGYATKRAMLVPDATPPTAAEIEAGAQVLAEYIEPEGYTEDGMAGLIGWILAKPERARHVKSLAELAEPVPGWGFVMTWANNGFKGLDVGDDPRAWRQVANG